MRRVLWEKAKSRVEKGKLQDEPVASCSGRSKEMIKRQKDREMSKGHRCQKSFL